jgi:D-amino-acid dehydrogenase
MASVKAKHLLIIGGGVIGLSTAYYAAQRGHRVTIIDRETSEHEGCSFGNAGMIAPSHFVPLAAPGMVALGLKWMWNPESPFYVKPRLNWDLMSWGYKFWRACTPEHVTRSAPLLRDLHLASRACFEELAALPGNDFGLVKKGLLMLCKTAHGFEEEARAAEQAHKLGMPAEVLDAKQTATLDPNIRMDIAGAVYFPKDCHLTPRRFMAGLKRQLEQAGVQFSWQTEQRIVVADGRARFGDQSSHAGGKGLQPHFAESTAASDHLRHFYRGARRGHTDGAGAPLRRHDGNRRAERGH